jgi:phosphate transport system permease protein
MTTAITPPEVEAPPPPPPSKPPQPTPRTPARRPLRPRDFKPVDVALLAATLLASYCLVWVVFNELTLLSGAFGFMVVFAVVFLLLFYVLNRQLYGRRVAADRVTGALLTMGVLAMLTPLVLLVGFIFVKGIKLLSWHLLTATQNGVLEVCARGHTCPKPGVFHAIIGTLEQVGIAVAIGVPLGIMTAIFLNEVGGRFTQPVRVMVTAMSGLPAIVAGIFIYSIIVVHYGFSGFAGGIALAILLLPTVTRGTEEVLKIVPDELREASAALGAPQWRTVCSVVLPTARSGIMTAVLLGIAVSVGETAPLLFTVFGANSTNWNPFNGPQASLPLLIYQSVKSTQHADVALGYAAALVLFLMVFFIFMLARILSSPWLSNKARSRASRRMANAAARGVGGGPVN